jgi:hypothetical protein
MSNLVFYLDYGPLLTRVHKSALIVYLFYDKFKNDEGIVQFTYNDLNDHLGLATSTIQKSNAILRELKLIEEVESASGKKYKLLPVKKLTADLKKQILTQYTTEDYSDQTSLRKKYLQDDIPLDFQQLLNKKVLKKAYKDLGTLRSGKDLCQYFKIDFYTFKLLHERDGEDSFKARFKALAKEVEDESIPKAKEATFDNNDRELTTYLYDKLNTLGAKPIHKNWFAKNCNIAHTILTNITLDDAKATLEFGFADEWWHDKITDLNCMNTLHSRYKLQGKKPSKISRSTLIPEAIRLEIVKEVGSSIEVNTYEDAFMLKQCILDGQDKEDIMKIVEILERSGIIPQGNDNLRFG